jgi:hypothetical protein
LPISTIEVWVSFVSVSSPSLRSACDTFSFVPVTRCHPGPAEAAFANLRNCAGVSVSGSTVMETRCTSRPTRSPRAVWIFLNAALMIGQLPLQLAKNELITTTFPARRSL